MILKKTNEVFGATHADLRDSLAWWQEPKLFLGRAVEAGPKHQLAMIAAIEAEFRRRANVAQPDESFDEST